MRDLVCGPEPPLELLPDGTGTHHHQVPVGGKVPDHLSQERRQVFQPMGIPGRLLAPAAVPDRGIVADMARRSVMRRYLGLNPLDVRCAVLQANDDRLP